MNARAQIRWLPGGRRLHMQDGPIDLVVEAFGAADEVEAAYRAACERFTMVLDELCCELPLLRTGLPGASGSEVPWPRGAVARRMTTATLPYATQHFITPMASVAGAVADEILSAMVTSAELSRAYVNDGGDIALHLREGEKFVVGMVELGIVERSDRPALFGAAALDWSQPVRGIATSGWRGRSFSLGIADAVTVLAESGAAADAAATIVANAVDLPGCPQILRAPARQLSPDSDLGDLAVTRAVGELAASEIDEALANGARTAESLLRRGLLHAAALCLQGEVRVVGATSLSQVAAPAGEGNLVYA